RGAVGSDRGLDAELVYVYVRGVEHPAAFGRGQHRNRVGRSRGAQVRAFERVNGDVNFGIAVGVTVFRAHPYAFADVEHRSFVALERSEERRVGKECRAGWWSAP